MKFLLIGICTAAILAISLKIQETELLLGYTLGVFGGLGMVVWLLDELTKDMK